MSKIARLKIKDVEYIANRLAKETMEWDEPIPDFATRFPHILESCLETPFQTFDGKSLYHGLLERASILFYLLIKNHPFKNGNKCIAVTTLFAFLYRNKKWLRVDNREFYNFVVWVAESNPKVKKQAVEATTMFLQAYLTDL